MMAMTSLFAAGAGTAATAGTVAATAGSAAAVGGAVGSTVAAIGPAAATSFLGASGTFGTAAAAASSSAGIFGSLGVMDVLGGAFDAVSIIGDVLGTSSEIEQAGQTAADRDLQALAITNQATLDEIRALEDLRARISASVVAAGSGGLAATGSVEVGIEEAVKQQEFETTVGGRDARIRAAQLEAEAESARGSTSSLIFKGLGRIGGKVFNAVDRAKARGSSSERTKRTPHGSRGGAGFSVRG